jgi:hypothetical protein
MTYADLTERERTELIERARADLAEYGRIVEELQPVLWSSGCTRDDSKAYNTAARICSGARIELMLLGAWEFGEE